MAAKTIDQIDPKLVEEAKTDANAFGKVYDFYFPKVYAFVLAKLNNNSAAAEDVTSDIFMKVLENLHKYQERGLPFGAWLFTVARNVLFDYYAKTNKTSNTSLDETIEIKDDKEESSPVHQAKHSELQQKVKAVMNSLPERDLSIVQMKFFSGLNNREIAATLDLTEQNVGIIIYRVLRKMKPDLNNLI